MSGPPNRRRHEKPRGGTPPQRHRRACVPAGTTQKPPSLARVDADDSRPGHKPEPAGPPPSLARRILTLPLVALATLLVLLDDLFRSIVKPAAAWLAGLKPFRRLEALIASLPPYPTLALFLIPMAVIWPIKLYALYLIGLGHVGQGTAAFVVAKIVGVGLAERLFAISRDKLLSIGWFAKAYYAVIRIRDRVHLYLKTPAGGRRSSPSWRGPATAGAGSGRRPARSYAGSPRVPSSPRSALIESRRPSAS